MLVITKNAKMKYVKLFLEFHWPGNTQIYAFIAESYVFIYIAQRFAQLRDQTTDSVFSWKKKLSTHRKLNKQQHVSRASHR